MRRFVTSTLLLLLCSSGAFAAQNYTVERSRSQAKFFIRHVVETVEGKFSDVSGTIAYDPADVTKSRVRVAIKVSSVDTGIGQRDHHLQGSEFFDADHSPEIIFESQRIEKRDPGLVAVGNFTMKGTTKTIEIPFTISQSDNRLIIHGSTSLNRRDYNVGSEEMMDNRVVLGNEVRIELSVGATLAR
jgi:polyisoprenoid-binding protein YceI